MRRSNKWLIISTPTLPFYLFVSDMCYTLPPARGTHLIRVNCPWKWKKVISIRINGKGNTVQRSSEAYVFALYPLQRFEC